MRGECLRHPGQPGAWLLIDGRSMLCDPCFYRQGGITEAINYVRRMIDIDPAARDTVVAALRADLLATAERRSSCP